MFVQTSWSLWEPFGLSWAGSWSGERPPRTQTALLGRKQSPLGHPPPGQERRIEMKMTLSWCSWCWWSAALLPWRGTRRQAGLRSWSNSAEIRTQDLCLSGMTSNWAVKKNCVLCYIRKVKVISAKDSNGLVWFENGFWYIDGIGFNVGMVPPLLNRCWTFLIG